MVESDKILRIENPANVQMHYNSRVNVGVVTPPDRLPVRNLYSYFDGLNLFRQLDYDTYDMQRRAKPKKGKFPTILKIIGGLLTGGILLKLGMQGIRKILHR